jgi:hypothetical protein
MDMKLNDVEVGTNGSELRVHSPATGRLTARVAAYLPEEPPRGAGRSSIPWSIEKARIAGTRTVKVEAVVNGRVVGEQTIVADGTVRDVAFDGLRFDRSSWVAMRILPSSHSNPIFVIVDDRPIRASRRSAEWCLKGVDQCWSQKERFYAAGEMADARAAYEHAREAYRRILGEAVGE